MKLLIHDEDIDQSSLDNGDDCIKYNVFSSLEELDAISPNSCKEITFVEDVLSSIKYQAAKEIIQKVATKCRKGGRINLAIIDARTLCQAISSNSAHIENLNEIIQTYSSVQNIDDIYASFKENNITIFSSKKDGIRIVLKAVRN
jgi:hypothetical protein